MMLRIFSMFPVLSEKGTTIEVNLMEKGIRFTLCDVETSLVLLKE